MESWEPLVSGALVLLGAFSGGLISWITQRREFTEQRNAKLNEYRKDAYARLLAEFRYVLATMTAGNPLDFNGRAFHEVTSQALLFASEDVTREISEVTVVVLRIMGIVATGGQIPGQAIDEAAAKVRSLNMAIQKELGLR